MEIIDHPVDTPTYSCPVAILAVHRGIETSIDNALAVSNPYPYISVSYDSPCMLLEYSPDGGTDRPSYFFDEFNARHFGAWDTDLAVHIDDYDSVILHCREMLMSYANAVEELLARGKAFR